MTETSQIPAPAIALAAAAAPIEQVIDSTEPVVRAAIDDLRGNDNDSVREDLNPDRWPEGKKPWQNPIGRSLFADGFYDEGPSIPEGTNVDDHIDYAHHYSVLDTDSSQQRVIEDARTGKSLVVEGPPGSGKSTTITNIVANAVADGKKVLVVSMKDAALEVVQRWLSEAGLGDVCLPLHGSHTDPAKVLADVRRTVELGKPIEIPRESIVERLVNTQTHLNGVCSALAGEVRGSGFNGYQVLSRLLAIQDKPREVMELDMPEMRTWTGKDFKAASEFIAALDKYYSSKSIPRNHPFYGTGITPESLPEPGKLKASMSEAAEAGRAITKSIEKVCHALGLRAEMTEESALQLWNILDFVADCDSGDGAFFKTVDFHNPAFAEKPERVAEMLNMAKTFFMLTDELRDVAKEGACKAPNLQTLRDLIETNARLQATGARLDENAGTCRELMGELCLPGQVPKRFSDMLRVVDKILTLKHAFTVLQEREDEWLALFGEQWLPDGTQGSAFWKNLEFTAKFLGRFIALAKGHPEFDKLAAVCKNPSALYELDDSGVIAELGHSLKIFSENRQALLRLMQFRADVARERFANKTVQEQGEILDGWALHSDRINDLIDYTTLVSSFSFPGKERVLELAESSPLAPGKLAEAMEFSWFSGLGEDFLVYGPLAGEFKSALHEEFIRDFRATDVQLLRQNSSAVALQHWQHIPRLQIAGQNAALSAVLKEESGTSSLKNIFSRAGRAMQSVKPVFLMDPASVAETLTPGAVDFDMVIFDEGGQISIGNGLGSILRGRQVLVFGDRKQTSPCNEASAGNKNLMEYLVQAGVPRRELSWHYRSLHEGLVQISNREFYEGGLSTFPCAERGRAALGLDLVSTSPSSEPDAVALAVLDHVRKTPQTSLGVIAVHGRQAGKIKAAVESLAAKNQELRNFLDTESMEPFFVKTIAEVRGDERDDIFISFSGEDGEHFLEPFECEGGLNDLNVLMTRARSRCVLYSSLSPEDIARISSSEGARILRDYLRYARDGQAGTTDSLSNSTADSFHSIIKSRLEALGYKVEANVGFSGVKVDLAVIDPKDPSRFVLGIMSDGENYQSLQSARERERLVPEALRLRGWDLHRVWIIDWFRDPEQELNRLITHLKSACRSGPLPDAESETLMEREIKRQPSLSHQHEALSDLVPYEITRLKRSDYLQESEVSTIPSDVIREVLKEVITVEGPIRREEAQRRVLSCLNLMPRAAEMQEQLAAAELDLRKDHLLTETDPAFLFLDDGREQELRDRSNSLGSVRIAGNIPPSEIDQALCFLARQTAGLSRDEMPDACRKMIGILPSPGDETLLQSRMDLLLQKGLLKEDQGLILSQQ